MPAIAETSPRAAIPGLCLPALEKRAMDVLGGVFLFALFHCYCFLAHLTACGLRSQGE